MKALWVNIDEAIEHNHEVMANSPKKGMSIERETWLLELIARECLSDGFSYEIDYAVVA